MRSVVLGSPSVEQYSNRNVGNPGSGSFALAARVFAQTVNVRSLFHRFALGAAVLAGSRHARANGVSTLVAFCSRHCFLLAPKP
jgi:hypothetical protein